MEDRIVGGIISSVLGDALGVPVEFEDKNTCGKILYMISLSLVRIISQREPGAMIHHYFFVH